MCFNILVSTSKEVFFFKAQQCIKMYFKAKLLIWDYYKVHFLKVYLSVLRNSYESVCLHVQLSGLLVH